MRVFEIENINIVPIRVGKYEARHQVTQLFETGVEVTLYYVIRNNRIYYYDMKEELKK